MKRDARVGRDPATRRLKDINLACAACSDGRSLTALAHRGHDFGRERVLYASQVPPPDLLGGGWGDDAVQNHESTYLSMFEGIKTSNADL